MTQAKNGDTVTIHYTGKLDDGRVFDTSMEREPVQFTVGQGEVIEGLETAIIGMEPGEKRTVEIEAEKAYGPYYNEGVQIFSADQMPEGFKPEVGQQVRLSNASGQAIPGRVIAVNEQGATIDTNHPLAGYDLVFDIHLLSVE